jgi:mannitol 2-dehydrogenase
MELQKYSFERQTIKSGILHIGVGNFHRAHQAYYTNLLLNHKDQHNWGICGVCMLPSDENIFRNLTSQHLDYTLTVCGRNGENEIHQIGSITELFWAIDDPEAILNKIADQNIRIITLTITEGGYNMDKKTNEFILNEEKIMHDLKNSAKPTTVFGFVAEGLRRRRNREAGGITILSCDNLQHNGNTAKAAFMAFIAAQDKSLAEWAESNLSFPNSMVDRITPATTPEDILRLNKNSGTSDKAPVYCEDFIQWVIEDNFIAGRPDWEKVGVEFTNDVTAYETMKLSLLNASHTLLSYPSFLLGYRKVDEAMSDQDIVNYIREFMDVDVSPNVPAPYGINLQAYKQTLIERFANKSVSDQLSRLCFDGISKFPVYIMPNLNKMIENGQDMNRVAFLIAAYRHYLKYEKDDLQNSYQIAEPWLTLEDKKLIISEDPSTFLELSAFKSIALVSVDKFMVPYLNHIRSIKSNGIRPALHSALDPSASNPDLNT